MSTFAPVDFSSYDNAPDKPSKSDKPKCSKIKNKKTTPKKFSYTRAYHFQNYLRTYKEEAIVDIPVYIINKIQTIMEKKNIKPDALTQHNILNILLKERLSKYYGYVYQIYLTLSMKEEKFYINNELEDELTKMFVEVYRNFDKGQNNFFPYSYVVYKMLEVLGRDDIKGIFLIPDNFYKISIYDIQWKKICEKLSWNFISTTP